MRWGRGRTSEVSDMPALHAHPEGTGGCHRRYAEQAAQRSAQNLPAVANLHDCPPLPQYRREAKGTQSLRVWWVRLNHLKEITVSGLHSSLTSHRRYVSGSTPTTGGFATHQAVFMPGYIIAQGETYNVSCIIGSRTELVSGHDIQEMR